MPGSFLQIIDQDGCDQISADNEKNIDTNKTAAEEFKPSVKENYWHDSKCAQPIDLTSVLQDFIPRTIAAINCQNLLPLETRLKQVLPPRRGRSLSSWRRLTVGRSKVRY